MTLYARVENGVVAELFTPPDGIDIADCFNAALVWNDITGVAPSPQPGWSATEAGGGWSYAAPVPPVPPPPSADDVLAEKIAAGIAITSTANADLNATYALDGVSTSQIYQIGLFASRFNVFPSGTTTQMYPDMTGAPHAFTVPEFIAFLLAVAPLVSALTEQAAVMAHGGEPAWPAQTATIA